MRLLPALRLPHGKTLLYLALLLPSLLMYIYKTRLTIQNHVPSSHSTFEALKSLPPPTTNTNTNLTVNLVLATLAADDISWTSRLQIPNLNIIRYISDSRTALYRPPVPKAREALMYHTYFHEFYDSLPDISILIHSHESPWHADSILFSSMLFTLSHLNLQEVQARGYANLRVSWKDACPDWINTTKTPEESWKQEEPFMAQAFSENFFPWGIDTVPEILAGPCCSQFAVSKPAILAHPKEQYGRHMRWLIDSKWSDYIVGRTWEHMFPFLFTGRGTDCPVEWEAFCRMYGVCFDGEGELKRYEELGWEMAVLEEKMGFWAELRDPGGAQDARKRVGEIEREMGEMMGVALERGRMERVRVHAVGDLYSE
jgi:hypothetical protein